MKSKLSRTDAIVHAINLARTSEFGVTAIKVELEAHLHRDDTGWDSESCQDTLMKELAELGLARQCDRRRATHHYYTNWEPVAPLTFGEFYEDGSVDSEFTFTLMLDDPQSAFLLPKIIEIWNGFCTTISDESGWDVDVEGSGMHMAFLNDRDGCYPSGFSTAHLRRFDNFQRSMTLLLPALYFLASSDCNSRPLEYREPRVTIYGEDEDDGWDSRRGGKYSAIAYNHGALEFRVFNTCYDTPTAILDNLVVMANCVRKYWTRHYVPSGLEKITHRTSFGNDDNTDLSRFYVTVEHVDLLNEGLERLKPSYYTIGELKHQRNFKVNKRTITGMVSRIRRQALQQYKEYEARFKWDLRTSEYRYLAEEIHNLTRDRDVTKLTKEEEADIITRARARTAERLQFTEQHKTPPERFIADRIEQLQNNHGANWVLEVA